MTKLLARFRGVAENTKEVLCVLGVLSGLTTLLTAEGAEDAEEQTEFLGTNQRARGAST